jgi:hypothetical protein
LNSFLNFTDQVRDDLIKNFIQDNPEFLDTYPNPFPYNGSHTDVNITTFLYEKAIKRDEYKDRPIYKTGYKKGIRFYPFIQKCSKSTRLKEIINNPEIKNMQYLIFMFDVLHNLNDFTGIINGYIMRRNKDKELQHAINLKNQEIIDKNRQLIELLESHRCPSPFYKKGILQLI